MRVAILDKAEDDLVEGFHFYQRQQPGLGHYFLESLYADIQSLHTSAGIHRKVHRRYHRLVAKRFPFAVYYAVVDDTVLIHAVVDCRRNPTWIVRHLR
jgi:plasmid stabilization system protein ParE